VSGPHPLLGWFEDASDTPAHDPGVDGTPCLVCTQGLTRPVVTVSLMLADSRQRSYFFRAHKDCWNGLSEGEQALYEGGVIDYEAERVGA
jgi:hypothetical protein